MDSLNSFHLVITPLIALRCASHRDPHIAHPRAAPYTRVPVSRLGLPIDHEFTQLIKGYQGERLRQAFHHFDADGDGYIKPDEFQRIIVVCASWRSSVSLTPEQEIAGHKLSDSVLARLPTLCTMNPGNKISYSEVIAFHNSEHCRTFPSGPC